jgi:hypothetical protein
MWNPLISNFSPATIKGAIEDQLLRAPQVTNVEKPTWETFSAPLINELPL